MTPLTSKFEPLLYSPSMLEQVLWWVISKLNAEVEKREEKREEVECNLTTSFDTRTKNFCEINKWVIY